MSVCSSRDKNVLLSSKTEETGKDSEHDSKVCDTEIHVLSGSFKVCCCSVRKLNFNEPFPEDDDDHHHRMPCHARFEITKDMRREAEIPFMLMTKCCLLCRYWSQPVTWDSQKHLVHEQEWKIERQEERENRKREIYFFTCLLHYFGGRICKKRYKLVYPDISLSFDLSTFRSHITSWGRKRHKNVCVVVCRVDWLTTESLTLKKSGEFFFPVRDNFFISFSDLSAWLVPSFFLWRIRSRVCTLFSGASSKQSGG